MKKITVSALALTLSLFSVSTLHAQTKFDVPQDVVLKVASDYPKYNKDMINAAKWLVETDLDKEKEKRKKVDAFVITWTAGSPDISINIEEPLMKITKDNLELLPIYMASYTRYMLEHKDATEVTATAAGLNAIMAVYKRGIGVVKNEAMDKLISTTNKYGNK